MEPRIQALIVRYKSAIQGPCWHGPSLRAALAGTTPAQALARPLPEAHCIAELVGHITFWEQVVCRKLSKQSTSVTPARNFPAPATQDGRWWKKLLAELKASHEQVLHAMEALRDDDLDGIAYAAKYTQEFMLAGLADHSLYHAGQISLLKNALARRERKSKR